VTGRRRADAERLGRAREFAGLVGLPVERWMHWPGWTLLVGRDVCGDEGRGAACWARKGCHGWLNGCGCIACAVRQARELALLDGSLRGSPPPAHIDQLREVL
jgi:hypothetical protein